MKKIGSFVLMAVMLLVSANSWAQNTISLVYHNGVKPNQTFSDLQTAIDYVNPGDSATITLSATQILNKGIVIPHVESAATDADKVANRAGQRICIDLNGNTIKTSSSIPHAVFSLVKGTLSLTGEGRVERANVAKGGSKNGGNWSRGAIVVSGADGRDASLGITAAKPDRSKQEWSVLYVGEKVEVISEYNDTYGIGIQEIGPNLPTWGVSKNALGYSTYYLGDNATGSEEKAPMWTKINKKQYSAFGVKIIVAGTVYGHTRGINVVGNINQTPKDAEGNVKRKKDSYPFYERNYPYILIKSTADVYCTDQGIEDNGNGGVYLAGWAILDISGSVHGQTGVFVKSGDLKVTDGTVYSDAPTAANSGNYHGDVAGSGIFVDTDAKYAGEQTVTIEGDSHIAGAGGSAIVDVLADNTTESQVSHVTITGGTIEAGDEGAINVTTQTSAQTEITGGGVQGTVSVGGTTVDVTALIPSSDDYHTTTITDEDGNKTVVISQGSAPTGDANVAGHSAGSSVKWTGTSENIESNVVLKELEINESSIQTLTIKSGYSLTADLVVLGDKARVIVEPGAKLIVKGNQGIKALNENNILLKANNTSRAVLLIHPDVKSNRHPQATVEFVSNSYTVSASDYKMQRFGIPTHTELTSMTTKYNGSDVQTGLAKFDDSADKWVGFGWINVAGKDENLDQLNNPFEYYQMQHNTPNMGTVVTMTGELVGNDNPELGIRGNYWNGFANSYMAPINGEKLLAMIPNTVDKAFYMYDLTSDQATWEPVTLLNPLNEILPMQPFLIRNTKAAANVTVNYGKAVYYPTTGEADPSPAPARAKAINDIAKAKLVVKGDACIDRLIVAEGEQFTSEFDNGYDAAKYMNDGINIYVTSDEKMSIFATDELENTYVGFQTVEGGAYAIEFTGVEGENFELIDLETGSKVLMAEGNMYTFTADANSANDYRFKIARVKEVATDIDAIEAHKNGNGIYTIMGQYVGEMNLWSSLPAGVYVVDGAKRVK